MKLNQLKEKNLYRTERRLLLLFRMKPSELPTLQYFGAGFTVKKITPITFSMQNSLNHL